MALWTIPVMSMIWTTFHVGMVSTSCKWVTRKQMNPVRCRIILACYQHCVNGVLIRMVVSLIKCKRLPNKVMKAAIWIALFSNNKNRSWCNHIYNAWWRVIPSKHLAWRHLSRVRSVLSSISRNQFWYFCAKPDGIKFWVNFLLDVIWAECYYILKYKYDSLKLLTLTILAVLQFNLISDCS